MLNTHVPGSLYEAFAPDKAKALWDRFRLHPEARMAEIELNVLSTIDDINVVRREVEAWSPSETTRTHASIGSSPHPKARSALSDIRSRARSSPASC